MTVAREEMASSTAANGRIASRRARAADRVLRVTFLGGGEVVSFAYGGL